MEAYTPEYLRECADRANAGMIAYFRDAIPMYLDAHHRVYPELSKTFQMVRDPEAYINGGFIERIKGLYSPEDREFILEMADKFERVKLGFAYFSLIRSTRRPLEAILVSQNQLRTGWQKTGIPLWRNESVAAHMKDCKELAFFLFFDDPAIGIIETMLDFHDIGEVVIGDFTPTCPISKADKARLERLAIDLLCKHTMRVDDHFLAKQIFYSFNLYVGSEPQFDGLRSKVKDCDLLSM
ncbi:MAG TPA: HD domain-containing protein, partial [Alphaproteobacteria bacterium]|nr:HD domain-containing protein [Alphaproteobacteria bacterium]